MSEALNTGVPATRVDRWVLRCLLFWSGFAQRIRDGEFEQKSKPHLAHAKYGFPPGTLSIGVTYRERRLDGRQGRVMLEGQYFADPQANPISDLDPKVLRLGDEVHRLISVDKPGDEVLQEPELAYPFIWMRKVYGYFRRRACRKRRDKLVPWDKVRGG